MVWCLEAGDCYPGETSWMASFFWGGEGGGRGPHGSIVVEVVMERKVYVSLPEQRSSAVRVRVQYAQLSVLIVVIRGCLTVTAGQPANFDTSGLA